MKIIENTIKQEMHFTCLLGKVRTAKVRVLENTIKKTSGGYFGVLEISAKTDERMSYVSSSIRKISKSSPIDRDELEANLLSMVKDCRTSLKRKINLEVLKGQSCKGVLTSIGDLSIVGYGGCIAQVTIDDLGMTDLTIPAYLPKSYHEGKVVIPKKSPKIEGIIEVSANSVFMKITKVDSLILEDRFYDATMVRRMGNSGSVFESKTKDGKPFEVFVGEMVYNSKNPIGSKLQVKISSGYDVNGMARAYTIIGEPDVYGLASVDNAGCTIEAYYEVLRKFNLLNEEGGLSSKKRGFTLKSKELTLHFSNEVPLCEESDSQNFQTLNLGKIGIEGTRVSIDRFLSEIESAWGYKGINRTQREFN